MGDEIYELKKSDVVEDDDQLKSINVNDVLEKKIIVYSYVSKDSPYHDGKYAMIDIDVEGDGTIEHKRVLMTSSKVLLDQLKKWEDKMPFRAVIEQRKSDKWKYYSFKPIE